jgi:hypothetical protein
MDKSSSVGNRVHMETGIYLNNENIYPKFFERL